MMHIFEGVKVLAIARQIAAPFAVYQLAMHGADVISVENPNEPDSMRFVGGANQLGATIGLSTAFLAQGANKKSISLNIATPEGQQIFKRLASDADVVIENLVAGKMRQYGLDYDCLKALNPRLVYCSITGFGQTGPYSKRTAIDLAVQAASGLMSINGTKSSGPHATGYTVADYATGYAAALGVVSALYHVAKTGQGQYIDVAMLDAACTMASADFCEAASGGTLRGLRGNGDGRYVQNMFRCADGALVIAATTEPRRQRLWAAIGRQDIPAQERFSSPEKCLANASALHEEIEQALSTRSAAEWEEILAEAGVAASVVHDFTQVTQHPQLLHRGFVASLPSDGLFPRDIRVMKAPYAFSETPASISRFPPKFGEHTNQVLGELGYGAQELAGLRARRVI